MSMMVAPARFRAPQLLTPANASWASAVVAWFDASVAAALTLSGSNVTTWASLVGTATLTGGNSPTYNPTTGINGTYPAVSTTGEFKYLRYSYTSGYPSGSGASGIWGVMKSNLKNFSSDISFGGDRALGCISANLASNRSGNDQQTSLALTAADIVGWNLLAGALPPSTLYLNGVASGTATRTTFATPAASLIQLGPNATGQVGAYGEVLITNRDLTTTERQEMEGYLAGKWGLQAYLPAGHPFKAAAPVAP